MPGDATSGSVNAVVDFHNHVIPGVDDGARDEDEARQALAAMRAEGVGVLVATPHLDASIAARDDRLAERMGELDAGWASLEDLVGEVEGLEIRRGAEVKLDTPEPDLADPRFRLGGGPFVLVEFPYFTVPPRSARVVSHLRSCGYTPIIAHPERYNGIIADLDVVREWRVAGAFLQVNGPSLTGRYGEEPRIAAFRILESGAADYLSSDYHARGFPGITNYRDVLAGMDGEEQMRLLTELNPARMLAGDMPLAVPPLAIKRSLWDRISSAFR